MMSPQQSNTVIDLPSAAAPDTYLRSLQERVADPAINKSERTRLQLLAAICEIVSERGPGELSINEIAARAAVSRPTFYTYFKDMNEALSTLLADFAAMRWYDLSPSGSSGAFLDGIREANLRYIQVYEMNTRMFAALASFEANHPNLIESREALNTDLARRTAGKLRRMRVVTLPDTRWVEVEAAILMLINLTERTAQQRFLLNNSILTTVLPAPEQVAAMISMAWETVLTRMILDAPSLKK